jgi:signal transduction histidine kinase
LVQIRESRVQVIDESDGLSNRYTTAVLEDSKGSLWVGTQQQGVDRIQNGRVENFSFDSGASALPRSVSVIYEDREKKVWVAAKDGSVYQWNGKELELQFYGRLDPTKVEAIYQDADQVLWFGGSRGLVRAEGDTPAKVGPSQGFPDKHVTSMSGDAAGGLWLGTADGCVYREDNGKIIPVGSPASLGRRRITCLSVITDQHAWAGTLGSGLHFWDGGQWYQFNEKQGLPDPRLTSLLTDEEDDFWISSLGGIFRVSRRELLERLQYPDSPLHWLRLNRADGLPTRECNGSSQPAGWESQDGRFWFPTSKGLVHFNPARINTSGTLPPIYLRKFRADGQNYSHSNGARISAGPGHTRLEFSYHGLDLSAPEKVHYRTRLLGLDGIWREVGNQRQVAFTAVPPGHYTFEVLAMNGDGLWSAEPASMEVIVEPHFWQTLWFLVTTSIGAIALAVSVGWASARRRIRRRIRAMKMTHAREFERTRIARDLHDDLGASVTEISILAALGAELREQEPLQRSLQTISSKTNRLVSSLDEIVWAINPREDTLRSLVEYLSAFCEEFLAPAGISLRFEITREIPDLTVESAIRHSIFLAFREACNNLVRHSCARNARLAIRWREQNLVISLRDDGDGIPEHVIQGDGLDNLRSRMKDCGGFCDIETTSGEGTAIRFTIPFQPPPKNA